MSDFIKAFEIATICSFNCDNPGLEFRFLVKFVIYSKVDGVRTYYNEDDSAEKIYDKKLNYLAVGLMDSDDIFFSRINNLVIATPKYMSCSQYIKIIQSFSEKRLLAYIDYEETSASITYEEKTDITQVGFDYIYVKNEKKDHNCNENIIAKIEDTIEDTIEYKLNDIRTLVTIIGDIKNDIKDDLDNMRKSLKSLKKKQTFSPEQMLVSLAAIFIMLWVFFIGTR